MDEIDAQSLVYIDTNIFIYFVEAAPSFHEPSRALFSRINHIGARIVTSELTIAECLYKPFRDGDADLVAIYETMFEGGDEVELVALDGPLARRAARHGAALGLKLLDAIHYVSALEAGCRFFLTTDGRFRSSPELRVITLIA